MSKLQKYLEAAKSRIEDYEEKKTLAKELDNRLGVTRNTNESKKILDEFVKEHNLSLTDSNEILSIIVFGNQDGWSKKHGNE